MGTTGARSTGLIVLTALMLAGTSSPAAFAAATPAPPDRIELPDGFGPEGITIDKSAVAYLGSLTDGDIYSVDLTTGQSRTVLKVAGQIYHQSSTHKFMGCHCVPVAEHQRDST